jgi:hypothetical protein
VSVKNDREEKQTLEEGPGGRNDLRAEEIIARSGSIV